MRRLPNIGVAGVYHVASKLAYEGLSATITSAAQADIFVSLPGNSDTLPLLVETSEHAAKTLARGNDEAARHYEWEIGDGAALANGSNLFVALVDLKGMEEMSDVFIVPSAKLHERFVDSGEPERWRYRPAVEEMEPYKNRWNLLEDHLRWNRARTGWILREELEARYGEDFAKAFDTETTRLLEATNSTIHQMADERFSARDLAEASALLRVLFRRKGASSE